MRSNTIEIKNLFEHCSWDLCLLNWRIQLNSCKNGLISVRSNTIETKNLFEHYSWALWFSNLSEASTQLMQKWADLSEIKHNWNKMKKIILKYFSMIGNLNLNIPMAYSPWHRKGGSQQDSKLSGGPGSLKMESGTERTVCAISKCLLITAL